jgi:acyl carrier protein
MARGFLAGLNRYRPGQVAPGLTALVRAALSSGMSDENEAALKREIKEAMVEELMLQQPAEQIADDAELFAPTGLGLDSVDALQLVVALEKRYGLKISDAEAAKGILRDVNTITAAVLAHRAAAA